MKQLKIQLTNSDWNKIENAIHEVLIKHLGNPADEIDCPHEEHPVFQLEENHFCYTADASCIDTFNYLLKISN